jgi:ergothioneine biosynthesis protein EgtB
MICNNIDKKTLEKLSYLTRKISKERCFNILHNCKNFYINVFTELQKNAEFETLISKVDKHIPHPLHFELGHVVHFFEFHFLGNTKDNALIKEIKKSQSSKSSKSNIFDSLINKPHQRVNNYVYSTQQQIEYCDYVFNEIERKVNEYNSQLLHPVDTYIIELCNLHVEMHKEVIYFITDQLQIRPPLMNIYKIETPKMVVKNDWIYIDTLKGDVIDIGSVCDQDKEDRIVIFDNERPSNKKEIQSFFCQKYPVTYGEYLEFINEDGYDDDSYWCFEGWNWRKENNMKHPINIFYDDDSKKWYRKHFDTIIELDYNLPVVHISYWEAQAYAKYRDARLPTEDEYVYLTTNGGKTKYPWGDDSNIDKYCNSDYKVNDVICVNYDKNKFGENKWGVSGLYGDCWFWTSSRFSPFDGFCIDPIYDTFSYPFFYDRIVVKGSSWCTGKELVYSKYRNSQEPDKCFHYTGIRLCR